MTEVQTELQIAKTIVQSDVQQTFHENQFVEIELKNEMKNVISEKRKIEIKSTIVHQNVKK
ncbi:hypothetical protein IKN40_00385 [bacterium]|nr:hypothetical protein [bacterium]